jgi:TIR domain-containing protein
MPANSPEATHLFISYASEELVLATWLARKLAALGYAVWFDQIKMLGGEPWPQTIDDAIKTRTFRMLALISAASLRKPKPTGERVLAQKIADQRAIPDFLIPLKVDGTELDWLTTAISYVPFQAGWAAGFRQLLEKLNDISAPKNLSNATFLAAMSFPTGEDLIVNAPEQVRTNVIRVEGIPPGIKAFAADNTLSDDKRDKIDTSWAHYRVNPQLFLAFSEPPKECSGIIKPTKEQWSWVDYDTIHGIGTRNIVTNLIVRSLKASLVAAGCCVHPKRNQTIYLPEKFTSDGWLRFKDFQGNPARLKIRGKATFKSFGRPPELNHHHFAFRLRVGRGLDEFFWVQLTPTLFFFDEVEEPIIDDRVGPRRRRVSKMWFNAKWLNRLLAAESILLALQAKNADAIRLAPQLHTIVSTVGLNEAALDEADETSSGDVDSDEDGEFFLQEDPEVERTDE